MPTRTSNSPPPRPDRPRPPANPHRELRGFETRRPETAVNRDTDEQMSPDELYGESINSEDINTEDINTEDINTNGSER